MPRRPKKTKEQLDREIANELRASDLLRQRQNGFLVGDRVQVTRSGPMLGQVGTLRHFRERDGLAHVSIDGHPDDAHLLIMSQDMSRTRSDR